MATTRTAGRHPTRPRPAPLSPPGGAARGPRLPDWFILIALAFMIASEYKFRRRSLADSLGGSLDIMVLAEIAVYGVAVLIMAAQHVKWGRPARPSIPMVVLWVYGGVMAASALYAPFPNLAMVRAGQPCFLELRTYRFRAHSMYDPELYRDKAEVARWKERDPIAAFRGRLEAAGMLSPEEAERLDREAAARVDDAVAFAEAGTLEPLDILTRHGYADRGTW